MDRTSSGFSNLPAVDRTDPIQPMDLPPENIRMIISFIDKSDNQSISHLAQTCTHLWEAAGADALVSFFYTAKDRFEQADNSRKIAIFSLLADWLPVASGRIPSESMLQVVQSLSSMADLHSNNKSELVQIMKACSTILSTAKSVVDNASTRIDDNTCNSVEMLSQLTNMSLAINQVLRLYTGHIERFSALVKAEFPYPFDLVKNI